MDHLLNPGQFNEGEILHGLNSVGIMAVLISDKRLKRTQFCRRAQNIMSGTASNYNLQRLAIGIFLIAVAIVASLATFPTTLLRAKATQLEASSLLVLHGLTMFASSYVEEEHHFWYWASSGWFALLFLKQ